MGSEADARLMPFTGFGRGKVPTGAMIGCWEAGVRGTGWLGALKGGSGG